MNRANDIKQKLSYTLLQYNNLASEIRTAQKEGKKVPFIGDKTGDILSGCRECFDYCAKDIADSFIVNSKSNKKLSDKYKQGKIRIYFPAYFHL